MPIRPQVLKAKCAPELYPHFAQPIDAYRPIPWWAWTGDMNDADVRAQLDDMKAKGVYEFFLFPIYGLEQPYMSAEYWERVDLTLRECQARGMKCWIYDEYNWPSGVCGGRVLRDHPEFAARALQVLVKTLTPGESVCVPVPPEELDGCYALASDGQRVEAKHQSEAGGCRFLNNGEEPVTVCAFWNRRVPVRHIYERGCLWNAPIEGYTDLLNPKAVGAFLESTYLAYQQRYPEAYPDLIPGYFTDEPGMVMGGAVGEAPAVPFTPDLYEAFEREHGYDLRDVAHRLVVEEGNYRRVRRDFWRWCARRLGSSYTKQLADWCERQRVALTGHWLGEEFVSYHVAFSGDLFEAAGPMQIPGIDLLGNADGYTYDFGSGFYGNVSRPQFHLVAKWMHGIVRHAGGREMMSEAFGVCDWGLNPSRQRKGTNYEAALGVTLFNDNSLIFGISDFRKFAIGGKHFTVPWWQHYRRYSDYCARVAGLHAEGRPSADIAVLYPRTALWAECDAGFLCGLAREGRHPALRIQEALAGLCDALLRRHYPFDIVPEPAVESATVSEGALRTAVEDYRVLILPCATSLPEAIVERAVCLVELGGKVILVGDAPQRNAETWEDSEGLRKLSALGLQLGLPSETEEFEETLDRLLAEAAPRQVTLKGPASREFVSSRRLYGEDSFAFVSNMTDEDQELEIHVRGARNVEVWHPDGGERFRPVVARNPDGASFRWVFAGGEAVFVVDAVQADSVALPALPPHRLPTRTERVLDGEWDLVLEPGNLLRLELDLRRDPENVGWRDGWFRDATAEGWEESHNRCVADPIDLRDAAWYWLRARVHCAPGLLTFPHHSRLMTHHSRFLVVADDRHTLECYVNGVEAPGLGRFSLWDQENRAFDVTELLREGENVIALRVRTSPYLDARVSAFPNTMSILQPVALVGPFTVDSPERPQIIAAFNGKVKLEQSLHFSGFPHFAGCAVYGKTVDLMDVEGPLTLDFPATRDSVEVWVNGQQAAVRPWPPYSAEISRLLKRGENRSELRVRTTLGNLLKETYGGRVHEEPFATGLWSPPVLRWRR